MLSGDPSTTEGSGIPTTEQAYTIATEPSDTAFPTKSANQESTQLIDTITTPVAPTTAVDTATTESEHQAPSGDFLIF